MYPILLRLGSFELRSWGVLVALGFLAGLYLAVIRAKEKDIKAETVYDLALYILISGLIGARLFFISGNIGYYLKDPIQILYLQNGGMAILGSITFAFIASLIFAYKNKISILDLGDIVFPGVLLGQAIGRIGCYLNACCYGEVVINLPWAVKFPGLEGFRHPTQLYEMALYFIAFVVLWVYRDRFKTKGMMFLSGAATYSIIRFIVELVRADAGKVVWLSMSMAFFLISVGAIAVLRHTGANSQD